MKASKRQCEYCNYTITESGDGYNNPMTFECHPDCKGEDSLICVNCNENEYNSDHQKYWEFDASVYCPPCFKEMLKENLTIRKVGS